MSKGSLGHCGQLRKNFQSFEPGFAFLLFSFELSFHTQIGICFLGKGDLAEGTCTRAAAQRFVRAPWLAHAGPWSGLAWQGVGGGPGKEGSEGVSDPARSDLDLDCGQRPRPILLLIRSATSGGLGPKPDHPRIAAGPIR